MSIAPLDSGSFDQKFQDPVALLVRPFNSCKINFRTLIEKANRPSFSLISVCTVYLSLPLIDQKFAEKTGLYLYTLLFCGSIVA